MNRISSWFLGPAVLLACAMAGLAGANMARAETLRVLAPSSMTDALNQAIAGYRTETGNSAIAVYAGTAALARQAAAGAPADLIITADGQWMDWLAAGDIVDPATRRDLFGNRLVLVGAPDLPASLSSLPIDAAFPLPDLLGEGRMALARTDSVPAGRYAKEALQNLGFWDRIKPRIVETENVRAALALVRRGEARLGIVYASDGGADSGVQSLGTFPPESHRAILYPGAVLRQANDARAAGDFLDYLQSEKGRAAFLGRGFSLP